MKVLGLVASPRKLGNSELLVKEMLSALPEQTEKAMIRLPGLDIRQCSACYACLPEGRRCVIPDDLEFVLDQIRTADAVILATPCYFLGTHTSLKMVSDRLISVIQEASAFSGKKCVVAISYGVEGWEGYAREAAVSFARFLHLDVIGTMLVKAASPGEVLRPEVIEEARRLAASLAGGESGGSPSREGEAHCCPDCLSSLLQLYPSGTVECRMCGLTGKLVAGTDGYHIRFNPRSHTRFSAEGMSEHGKLLETIRDRYIAERHELNKLRKPYQAFDWWVKPAK